MSWEHISIPNPTSPNKQQVFHVQTEPDVLKVTEKQFAALSLLARDCERSGTFNEQQWLTGVRNILGFEIPPARYVVEIM